MSQERSLVGEGARMKDVYQFLKRVAPTDSTVLIEGESGTGKELAARALHRNSPRASKPFVAINCSAIPETLLESDLFGHERGPFTGAVAQKKGRIEVADGGVVFLGEIGELAPALQVALLRVLPGRDSSHQSGYSADCRDQLQSGAGGARWQVPSGSVLPAGGAEDYDAHAARPPRRYSHAGAPLRANTC